MFYIRVSLMRSRQGHEEQVAAIMDDLVTFYRKQHGFVLGYKLRSADDSSEIGRLTVWRAEKDADAAASMNHNLSLRAELLPLIVDDSHEERSFYAEEESKPLAALLHRLRV